MIPVPVFEAVSVRAKRSEVPVAALKVKVDWYACIDRERAPVGLTSEDH